MLQRPDVSRDVTRSDDARHRSINKSPFDGASLRVDGDAPFLTSFAIGWLSVV